MFCYNRVFVYPKKVIVALKNELAVIWSFLFFTIIIKSGLNFLKYTLLLFMKNVCFLIILTFCCHVGSYGQDFKWVRQVKGLVDQAESASFVEVDSDGNTYTLGKSNSITFDLDPTPNGVQIIDNHNAIVSNPQDIYLIKLNNEGDYMWGKTLSVLKEDDLVYGLKFDSEGNIYVLAFITELYNTTLIHGYGSVNIIKIDPNGNEIYRRKLQNTTNINSGILHSTSSFDIDSANNIYVTGTFNYNVTLDNHPQNNLTANGNSIYLLKLDQSGEILWTKNVNEKLSGGISLKIDSNDAINLLFTCFDNPNNGHSLNIIKLNNTNGTEIWKKTIKNAGLTNFALNNANDLIIIGGASNGTVVDLNPDPGSSFFIQDKSFVLFLDSNGNYYDSKLFDLNITFTTVEVDTLNNYHFGGKFQNGTTDFDPSANDYLMSSTLSGYYYDGFYLKLDKNNAFVKAFMIGFPSPTISSYCYNSLINSIKIQNENLFMVGEFAGAGCDLDPSLTSSYLLNSFNSNVINYDGFILKLATCTTLPPEGNANQSFCSVTSSTLNSLTPNSTLIKWYDSAISTTPLDKTTPLTNGQIYYATKQEGECPESSGRLAVTVTINPTPAAPIANDQVFCKNNNATIANLIAVGQNLKWYSTSTDATILPSNTLLENNIDYYVSQTGTECESSRSVVHVTVYPEIVPIATTPQLFCSQQNATLNDIAISGQNIKWYDSQLGDNLLSYTTVLVNGKTYYATQTSNSCESTRVPVVISIQNTAAPTAAANQTFCAIQNSTLAEISINGSNIIWYNSISDTNPLSNTTILTNGTTYYATQTVNNCSSVNRVAITVDLINSLNANDYSEIMCDDLNDGSELITISNYNSSLISNTTNCTFDYYSSLSGATTKDSTTLIPSTTNYKLGIGSKTIYVRITSNNGCYQIVQLNLTVVTKPIIAIPDRVAICENNSVTIDAGVGFDSYLWSTGSTLQRINITQPDSYSVSVTKNHGSIACSATKNFTTVLSNIATISSIITEDWTDSDNVITVNTTGIGAYEYSIDGVNYQESNVFNELNSGVVTVYIRDKNGCGITQEEVSLLIYPKYFTPNGDGYNDAWSIRLATAEPQMRVTIFDRYGKLLKTLRYGASWDGKHNGNELPSTDYWFIVIRENGQEYKGHFTLKR